MNCTSSHRWKIAEQGLENMSVWLNIMLPLCCHARSYLSEFSIFLCLSEPLGVFRHVHNLITVSAMEELGLISRSICLLAPL